MFSDQPLVCCICARRFVANAGDGRGHLLRAGVCGYDCNVRKKWRTLMSILGAAWSSYAEDEHVRTHSPHTDEEHDVQRREMSLWMGRHG